MDLFNLTSSFFFFLVFYQARISSEEASILCPLYSGLFTSQQDGPSQSFGEGMKEAFLTTPYCTV